MIRLLAAFVVGLLLLGAAIAPVQSRAFGAGRDWAAHSGGDDESGFSRLTGLTARNVSRLGLAWSLDLPDERALEATPLAINGRLYFTGSFSTVYCVDGRNGRLLWKHDPQIHLHSSRRMAFVYAVNRGVAFWKGTIFAGTLDGRLLALDARTGKLRWSVQTLGERSAHTITGAPRVFNGKVLIGNGGADYGARGYVTAYDALSGRQLWRFYTVPGDPADASSQEDALRMAAKTWSGEWWKVSGGGGTVWDSITYDAELNRVYLGVGNSGPYDPAVRSPQGGDNLFIASIVALDADTGRYLWHYQVNPREAWDYKATTKMIAATVTLGGRARKVLMQSPTNGFFYVLDRETGQLLSAEKIGKVTWAARIDLATGRPVETANARYESGPVTIWPSPYGAHNWQAMSFNPVTGLVYIPYMQLGARYVARTRIDDDGRLVRTGGVIMTPALEDAEDGTGTLVAWDPIAQERRWSVKRAAFWNGGTLTTAGGLVFQGTGDGMFEAYEARAGARLWGFDAGLGIIAAPISYSVGGRQQVSVLVGYGGAGGFWSSVTNRGWKYRAQTRRLLTFALDGKARLPDSAAADFSVRVVDDPRFTVDPAAAEQGAGLYGLCAMCHGEGLVSAGGAPDLRESAMTMDFAAMKAVLREGAMLARGMPQFAWMSDEQVAALQAFIRREVRSGSPQSPGG